MKTPLMKVLITGLLFGVFFNALGWLGNNLWLGADWKRAAASVANEVVLPYSRLAREAISLVFDFVFGITMCWMYARTSDRSFVAAFKFVVVYWLATVGTMYLAIVNSRLLPWEVSLKTSLLALVLFLPAAFILPRVFKAAIVKRR
jgi:hypothetical protein